LIEKQELEDKHVVEEAELQN